MKKRRFILMTSLAAAVLLAFSACSQDEIAAGDEGLLPDGQHPLRIGDVNIVVQSSEKPWNASPQTRVAESNDDNSSVWQVNDVIGMRLEGTTYVSSKHFVSTGQYYVKEIANGNVSLSPIEGKGVYWRNTHPIGKNPNNPIDFGGGVIAWYPDETAISLSDQSSELAYVIKAEADTKNSMYDYDDAIPLSFTHQLAKVWVKLTGERASQVSKVEVYGYTSCTNTQGIVTTDGAQQGWITMHKATYGTETYWEASLVPGEIGDQNTQPFVRLNGTTEVPISTLTTLVAGNLHTVTVTVRAWPNGATQITSTTGNISDKGNYYVTGNLNAAINITGGSPHIYLYNANVSVSSGSAINITGGTPTIHVVGEGNSVSSSNNTGIAVSGGATVTITGNGTADILTANGGVSNLSDVLRGTAGAGIGSPVGGTQGGNVVIRNVTVNAKGETVPNGGGGAGIGSSSNGPCGDITIENAVVNATGGYASAAIGMGCNYYNSPSIGDITITNSNVTATSGYYAATIGYSRCFTNLGGGTYCSGKITITTDDLNAFLSRLTLYQAVNYTAAQRIGKGQCYTLPGLDSTFRNTDNTADWEGVIINGMEYKDGVD